MSRVLALVLALTGCAHPGPSPSSASSPETDAEARYAELVRRAEAGEEVDFRALRLAWLHGPATRDEA